MAESVRIVLDISRSTELARSRADCTSRRSATARSDCES
jgi:hypothetical protein